MNLEYIAIKKDDNKLLKNIIRERLSLSNRLFNKLKLSHNIFINNNVAYANDVIHEGDKISINLDYDEEDNVVPQKSPINILYEDEWYIALDKPANIVVHPCSYHPDNTLSNYLKYYLNNKKKIRPVNRLDNGTSGIVLFAKNEYAQELFKNLNKEEVKKEYLALVEGFLESKEGTINAPIARKEGSIIQRCIDYEKGQEAITKYKVISEYDYNDKQISLLNVLLLTGRTHQIRVHFSYINHSLIGDTLYGKKNDKLPIKRQALHSYKLTFKHPITHEKVEITAKIPDDLNNLIKNYK